MSSEPLRLGSRKSPMAQAGFGAPVGAYPVTAGVHKLHLEGVVLGLPAASFQLAVLDSTSGSGRMVVREHGEADAESLGRELAACMLAPRAANLMRAENTDGNDRHD